ncbi:Short-chain dehydrogenase/reductase SDR [Labilithrix luteola]|uniref:Short-chain dehydrogenase/reductase SDR n=1 Tax=Labilithrix luteola TaxID=1391654 RepID=A0A0K1QD15_9BACT|nr:SDR family NAD(P)-dependent oxidoreductase [Labilithrix luteola]AKV03676.1 Short-chain dehydrogenase/reductase SDR [Labilithrix luteola]
MSKTIIVAGFGPGISSAVAEKFGKSGFSVALVGRSEDKLATGVKALEAKGIKAAAFPTDLSDPAAARALIGKVRSALGPITVLHWNAYPTAGGDLLATDTSSFRGVLDIGVVSLLGAIQEALPDLRQQKDSAILATNGGLAFFDPSVDTMGVQWNCMGLSVANSAKHKMLALLAEKLKPEGIYVGEVVVTGTVKGTAFDSGNATLDPAAIADKFWGLYTARKDVSTTI